MKKITETGILLGLSVVVALVIVFTNMGGIGNSNSFFKDNVVFEDGNYKLTKGLEYGMKYEDAVEIFDKEKIKYTEESERNPEPTSKYLLKDIVTVYKSKLLDKEFNVEYKFVENKLQNVIYSLGDLKNDEYIDICKLLEKDLEKTMPKTTDTTDINRLEDDPPMYVRYWVGENKDNVFVQLINASFLRIGMRANENYGAPVELTMKEE